jgi:Mce-associated membrane protein
MRAAVERDNDDGSVDVLMAVRIKVDNVEASGQEYGYRLRVKMAREEGRYKITKLDQVAK